MIGDVPSDADPGHAAGVAATDVCATLIEACESLTNHVQRWLTGGSGGSYDPPAMHDGSPDGDRTPTLLAVLPHLQCISNLAILLALHGARGGAIDAASVVAPHQAMLLGRVSAVLSTLIPWLAEPMDDRALSYIGNRRPAQVSASTTQEMLMLPFVRAMSELLDSLAAWSAQLQTVSPPAASASLPRVGGHQARLLHVLDVWSDERGWMTHAALLDYVCAAYGLRYGRDATALCAQPAAVRPHANGAPWREPAMSSPAPCWLVVTLQAFWEPHLAEDDRWRSLVQLTRTFDPLRRPSVTHSRSMHDNCRSDDAEHPTSAVSSATTLRPSGSGEIDRPPHVAGPRPATWSTGDTTATAAQSHETLHASSSSVVPAAAFKLSPSPVPRPALLGPRPLASSSQALASSDPPIPFPRSEVRPSTCPLEGTEGSPPWRSAILKVFPSQGFLREYTSSAAPSAVGSSGESLTPDGGEDAADPEAVGAELVGEYLLRGARLAAGSSSQEGHCLHLGLTNGVQLHIRFKDTRACDTWSQLFHATLSHSA
ncbi:hypothetical protein CAUPRSCDRAFT_10280 [Caulochytrium protostelioides]|nr:hypothetical protein CAUPRSCDRAFT_10280 [Caulochytrium protostelioides]